MTDEHLHHLIKSSSDSDLRIIVGAATLELANRGVPIADDEAKRTQCRSDAAKEAWKTRRQAKGAR